MAANDVQFNIIGRDMATPAFRSVNSAAARTTAQIESLGRATSNLNQIFTNAAGFAAGISGFNGLTASIQGTIGSIYNFKKNMEVHEIGMAGILSSMTEMNGRTLTWGESLSFSKDIMSRLNSEALRTAATTEELANAFRGILGPALNAKMTIQEIIQLTSTGVNAVKSIMPGNADAQRQIVQELRDLVAGGIQPASSTLATALGLRDSDIKRAKESADGLYKFLMDRLKGFETSAPAYAKTWQGITEQIKEGFTLAGSQGTDKLFNTVKESLAELAAEIIVFNEELGQMQVNPELVSSFSEISDTVIIAGQEIKAIGSDIAVVAVPMAEAFGGALKFAAENAHSLAYAIGGWVLLRKVAVNLAEIKAVTAGAATAQTLLGRAVLSTSSAYREQLIQANAAFLQERANVLNAARTVNATNAERIAAMRNEATITAGILRAEETGYHILANQIRGLRQEYMALGFTAREAGVMQLQAAQAAQRGNFLLATQIIATRDAQIAAMVAARQSEAVMVTGASRAMAMVRGLGSAILGLAGGWPGIIIGVGYLAHLALEAKDAGEASEKLRRQLEDIFAAKTKELDLNKQQVELNTKQLESIDSLVSAHAALKDQIDSGTLSEEKLAFSKEMLQSREKELTRILGESAMERIKQNNWSKESINKEKEVFANAIKEKKLALSQMHTAMVEDYDNKIIWLQNCVDAYYQEVDAFGDSIQKKINLLGVWKTVLLTAQEWNTAFHESVRDSNQKALNKVIDREAAGKSKPGDEKLKSFYMDAIARENKLITDSQAKGQEIVNEGLETWKKSLEEAKRNRLSIEKNNLFTQSDDGLSSKYPGTTTTSKGRLPGGSAAKSFERAYEEKERLTDKIADMIAKLDGKMRSETGTVFENSTAKLAAEVANMGRELDKSKIDFEKYGIKVEEVYAKIGEYQDAMAAKFEKQRGQALRGLRTETAVIAAGINSNPIILAEAEYEKELAQIQKERENDEVFKKAAKNQGDIEARIAADEYYLAKMAAADKKLNRDTREGFLNQYEWERQYNQNLVDLGQISVVQLDELNNQKLINEISYLQNSLDETEKYSKEYYEIHNRLTEAIRQRNEILSRNMKEAAGIAVTEIKKQQLDYAELYKNTWSDLDSSIKGHFKSILTGAENMADGIKGTILDLKNSIISMFAEIAYQQLIMQPVQNWFTGLLGNIGGGAAKSSSSAAASAYTGYLARENFYSGNPPKYFAKGGVASGWSIVGEEGPELVNFSNPARVYDAQKTKVMTEGKPEKEQPIINININVQATDVQSFLRSKSQVLAEIGRGISIAMRRNK